MITKKTALQLVDEWSNEFIKKLKLNKKRISINVYHSESKWLKAHTKDKFDGLQGCTYPRSTNKWDIILLYDAHHSNSQFVSTLIHELLHVKMYALTDLISKKNERRADIREEKIVLDLERFIRPLLDIRE